MARKAAEALADIGPHRHLDQVDFLRMAVPLVAVQRAGRSIEKDMIDFFADWHANMSFRGRSLIRRSFTTFDDVYDECAEMLHLVTEVLGEGANWIGTPRSCIVARQSRRGAPRLPWARMCRECGAVHIYPGREGDDSDWELLHQTVVLR